jgi:arylsulfatase A-like enzyme
LRGFKAQVWEGGIRVPFMVQWKDHLPAGKVDDRPVIQLDIVPTALAAAGIRAPDAARLDGVNLLPYLTDGTAGSPHKALFWRFGRQRAVRMGDWKLTDMGRGAELFNITGDISETRNLAALHPEKLRELERAYAQWNADNIAPKWLPRALEEPE